MSHNLWSHSLRDTSAVSTDGCRATAAMVGRLSLTCPLLQRWSGSQHRVARPVAHPAGLLAGAGSWERSAGSIPDGCAGTH